MTLRMQSHAKVALQNHLPVGPKKKWDNVGQYIEFLRHFSAYEYAKEFLNNGSVLEIGCGIGYGAYYLTRFSSGVTAIDISKKCTTYCHAKYKSGKLTVLQASGLNIPLKDNSTDIALSFQVIEHIEPKKVKKYLSEVKRVLKNKGVFIVSTPNKKLRLLPFQKPRNPEHMREYSDTEFRKVLQSVFENVEVHCLKGSEEIQSIHHNLYRQSPFEVYFILPLYPFLRKIMPSSLFEQLKASKKSVFKDKKSGLIPMETFKKYQTRDFKILSYSTQDCLDFYGICRKAVGNRD